MAKPPSKAGVQTAQQNKLKKQQAAGPAAQTAAAKGSKAAKKAACAGCPGPDPALTRSKGAKTAVSGVSIGDPPKFGTNASGEPVAKDVHGNDVTINQPRKYDSRVDHPDQSVTYTKRGKSVTYDKEGFPVFDSKADVYLDPKHVDSGNQYRHFQEANEKLGEALRNDKSLQKRMGLSDDQVAHLMRKPGAGEPPEGLTWHHHQDVGRMQLVTREQHQAFRGGHTGGMALWGGG